MRKVLSVSLLVLFTYAIALNSLTPAEGFQTVGTLALPLTFRGGSTRGAAIDSPNGFVYFSSYGYYNNIEKIRLSNFSLVSDMELVGGYPTATAVLDSRMGYAYFGAEFFNITRIRLEDFTVSGSLALSVCKGGGSSVEFSSAIIDNTSGFAYFGTSYFCREASDAIHPQIAKLRLSNFSLAGILDVEDPSSHPDTPSAIRFDGLSSAVIDPMNGFAYFATESPSQYMGQTDQYSGEIMKIRLSDFSVVGNLTLSPGEYGSSQAAVLDAVAGFAYFGVGSSNGGSAKIVRIRLSDFTLAGTVSLNPNEGTPTAAIIDTSIGYAYFGTGNNPGRIIQVRLSDFSRTGTLSLDTQWFSAALVDPDSGLGYFYTQKNGAFGGGSAMIVKLLLSGEGVATSLLGPFNLSLTSDQTAILLGAIATVTILIVIRQVRRTQHKHSHHKQAQPAPLPN